ncbi:MAG: rhodanese-like domain-containing protein [Bacteroidia bacterium]
MLAKLFVTLLLVFNFIIAFAQNATLTTLTIKDFEKGIKTPNAQVLDVRTKQEFEGGHLNNALNANFNNIKEFNERTDYLDKEKPLYVYCLSGGRSEGACELLMQKGFTKVYNMQGGISAWKAEQKPVMGASPTKSGIQETEFNFLTNKNQNTLVVISTKWCPPCRKLKIEVDSLKQEIKNVKFVELDADENKTICTKLNVKKYPLVIHYKLGKQVWRNEGFVTKKEMKAQLLKK